MTASGTTPTCTRSKVDLTPQYSAKWLIIIRIIVQLVTITVIPDTLHGVYRQQFSLNEGSTIDPVDYLKSKLYIKKYRSQTN
jgi:hypothetical protein